MSTKAGSFPPHLTDLQLSFRLPNFGNAPHRSIQELFPMGLTRLVLRYSGVQPPALIFSSLPRSLTTLETPCPDVSVANIRGLPQSLTHLTLFPEIAIDDQALVPILTALPPSLQTLYGIFSAALKPEVAAALPSNLTGELDQPVELPSIPFLPNGLYRVIAARESFKTAYDTLQSGTGSKTSEQQEIFRFPTSLRALSLDKLRNGIGHILPANLTEIHISDEFGVEIAEKLPRSLYRLSARLNSTLVWPLLPRRLTSLDASETAEMRLGNQETAMPALSLPRNLTELRWGIVFLESAHWFTELPPRLESLMITVAGKLEPFVHLLPRSLLSLVLSFSEPTKELYEHSMSNLPPKLTSMCISEPREYLDNNVVLLTDVSFQSIPPLPKSITWLELPYSTRISAKLKLGFRSNGITTLVVNGEM
jgi:hypothetical protein